MTTLQQTFAKHTEQDYPPKFVFCYNVNHEIRSLNVKFIAAMESFYECLTFKDDFPVLTKKAV